MYSSYGSAASKQACSRRKHKVSLCRGVSPKGKDRGSMLFAKGRDRGTKLSPEGRDRGTKLSPKGRDRGTTLSSKGRTEAPCCPQRGRTEAPCCPQRGRTEAPCCPQRGRTEAPCCPQRGRTESPCCTCRVQSLQQISSACGKRYLLSPFSRAPKDCNRLAAEEAKRYSPAEALTTMRYMGALVWLDL